MNSRKYFDKDPSVNFFPNEISKSDIVAVYGNRLRSNGNDFIVCRKNSLASVNGANPGGSLIIRSKIILPAGAVYFRKYFFREGDIISTQPEMFLIFFNSDASSTLR